MSILEADLKRLESAMAFMTFCGMYNSTYHANLVHILTMLIERTHGNSLADSNVPLGRGRGRGRGRARGSVN